MARAKTEAFEDRLVRLAAFARALGHPARIEILRHLVEVGEQPCMTIVNALPLSQPACSRHIHELLHAGLLESRTDRNRIFYRIREGAMDEYCALMHETLMPRTSTTSS